MKLINQLPIWMNWGLAFPLIVLNGWLLLVVFQYFESLISIFVLANLLAFILNYLVDFLVDQKIPRFPAVFLVVMFAFLLLAVLGITIAPLIITQLNELLTRLPSWIESGGQQINSFNDWAVSRNLPVNLDAIASQLTEKLSTQLQSLTGNILSFVLGTLGSVVDLLLTLVLTFYLLLHGEQLWDGIYQWLPQPKGQVLRQLLRQNFHNYYVGQASLAAIIGLSSTLIFLFLKVPFGLLFSLGIAFMALFPFGASFSISLVSFLVALQNFWLGLKVLIVTIIIEQIIENGVAPRLLGGFIGLNPVWILLSLLIGAQVGGVIGLLIAVPLAGFINSSAKLLRVKATEDQEIIP